MGLEVVRQSLYPLFIIENLVNTGALKVRDGVNELIISFKYLSFTPFTSQSRTAEGLVKILQRNTTCTALTEEAKSNSFSAILYRGTSTNGTSLNETILQKGWATYAGTAPAPEPYDKLFREAEAYAKRAGNGLWNEHR